MNIKFNKAQKRLIKMFVAQFHGKERVDTYKVFTAIAYIVYTGCQWHMLPSYFPKYTTVYFGKKLLRLRISWALFVLCISHSATALLHQHIPKITPRYATLRLTYIVEPALSLISSSARPYNGAAESPKLMHHSLAILGCHSRAHHPPISIGILSTSLLDYCALIMRSFLYMRLKLFSVFDAGCHSMAQPHARAVRLPWDSAHVASSTQYLRNLDN